MDGKNGGWEIGPFFVKAASKRGLAFLRVANRGLLATDPRRAVKFSLDKLDCLWLDWDAAQRIAAALTGAGISASVGSIGE